ncbi:TSPc domain-containing protein [Mycena indigotica]|uniref:TSPc domain-containing protein n=1 Tax=Mycena indigotica TaxID=2126181 RepID=A0A8H6VUY9_9AGAR|nr:TSPc domain-containing protein [Mycena indigotica]XP_037215354.1 TSPc domain-containing protein [Mycena indigotica]KAF7292921.1 TSPc domain-containing protein [Mycena indigotica]KAF7292926.1 TSPc domain-containing protein [Mycena indigotica]
MKSVVGLLVALAVSLSVSLPVAGDPCAAIAGKSFVLAPDALACLKSFPFNETLRQNVLTHNIARVFDFFTFEDYYLRSPVPFQESTSNIRAELARINTTTYATDYDFNWDLYTTITQLNDGHTRWFPDCYTSYQSLAPAPIVSLEINGVQGVYIIPDLVDFINSLGANYTNLITIDWQRLAGAKVVSIQGQDPYEYVDFVAKTVSGNYLDHGVRVNSVFSSYRLVGATYSQRFGDLAGPTGVAHSSINMQVIVNGSTKAEAITLPYIANFAGAAFTNRESFWANNCVANDETNGVDFKNPSIVPSPMRRRREPIASIVDKSVSSAFGLPPQFQPTLPVQGDNQGIMKAYVLPGNRTGVLFVGSFGGNFSTFQTDVVAAFKIFKASGVTQLMIDLTNNGGGFVCLGQFLHSYLAGTIIGYPGFQSTNRANPLARKIVASDIKLGLTDQLSFYTADNWAFLNGTQMPANYNYMDPDVPLVVNGKNDVTSQRFHDTCELSFDVPMPKTPPIDLRNIAIVSNGNCASTCAMFSTLMFEKHQTKIAVFGGKPNEDVQFKGMAGNQVLEWIDIDSEIKTANLKDDPLAPADLLVSGNFRHNWRAAWSFVDERLPIAYVSELPKFRFAYTSETYNNPQNLWLFSEKTLFGK